MEAPFLPPPMADNPAPKKKSPFALWFILIVMVIAIWNLMAPSPHAEEGGTVWRLASGLSTFIEWTWWFWIIATPFGYLIWLGRAARPFNLAQEPGLTALADGRLDDAAAIFREVGSRFRRKAQYAAVARYNLAIVLRRQGKIESAIAELIAVEKGAGLVYASEVRLLAAISLAESYAQRGELEAAQRWLDEARKRLARAGHRNHSACLVRVADAILACRAGRFDEALRGLERDWRQLEGNLALPTMREAWLMRAYATAQLGGVRGEGAATPWITLLRGAQIEYLAVDWPELRTFLESQSL
jgi:tetratricopeptide (TPR) repeat protein